LKNNTPASENFDNTIQISPSVNNVEPTGVGPQQNFQGTIRGLRYTQFNNTCDGLVLPGSTGNLAPQPGGPPSTCEKRYPNSPIMSRPHRQCRAYSRSHPSSTAR
jgi:hypothetical protein